jgi:hypothetical protein
MRELNTTYRIVFSTAQGPKKRWFQCPPVPVLNSWIHRVSDIQYLPSFCRSLNRLQICIGKIGFLLCYFFLHVFVQILQQGFCRNGSWVVIFCTYTFNVLTNDSARCRIPALYLALKKWCGSIPGSVFTSMAPVNMAAPCRAHRYLMSRLSLQLFYLWRHVSSTAPPFILWWSNLEILFGPLHRSAPFIEELRRQAIQTEPRLYIAETTQKTVYNVICLWPGSIPSLHKKLKFSYCNFSS